MKKQRLSGPAIFMYSVIVLTVILSAVCFSLYYSGTTGNDVILWIGIVSFMIIYHFGLRLLEGVITNKFNISYEHPLYSRRESNYYRRAKPFLV